MEEKDIPISVLLKKSSLLDSISLPACMLTYISNIPTAFFFSLAVQLYDFQDSSIAKHKKQKLFITVLFSDTGQGFNVLIYYADGTRSASVIIYAFVYT